MHGTRDDELRWRHMHGEKDIAVRRLLHAALAAAEMLFQHRLERIAGDIGSLDQALFAGCRVGDDDRRTPRGAFGIQSRERVDFHRRLSPLFPRRRG